VSIAQSPHDDVKTAAAQKNVLTSQRRNKKRAEIAFRPLGRSSAVICAARSVARGAFVQFGDFVLDLEFLSLQLQELQLVGQRMVLLFLDFLFKRVMTTLKFNEMALQRHADPPSFHFDDISVTQLQSPARASCGRAGAIFCAGALKI
jgi:hypothetical protein